MKIKKYEPTDVFLKAVVYGPSGAGKTFFGSTAPKPIFASAEGGLLSISDKKPEYAEIKSLKDLMDLLHWLKTQPHDYETVVIDSITEINELIKEGIKQRTGKAMQIQDWGELAEKVIGILRGFRDLPMHVIFVAQESYDKDDQAVIRVTPDLNGKAADRICYFMDIVAYLYMDKDGTRKILAKESAKYPTKARRIEIEPYEIDFSEWVEKARSMPVVDHQDELVDYEAPEEETKKPYKSKPAPNITKETLKELVGTWDQYWAMMMRKHPEEKNEKGLLKYTQDRSLTVRDVTMEKLYNTKYIEKLKENQGRDMIIKLLEKIRNEEKPKEEEPPKPEEPKPPVETKENEQKPEIDGASEVFPDAKIDEAPKVDVGRIKQEIFELRDIQSKYPKDSQNWRDIETKIQEFTSQIPDDQK